MQAAVVVKLDGHLTNAALHSALQPAGAGLPVGGVMIVDCTDMTGYDLDARHAFVAWQREHKARLEAVAVLTHNVVWHMVISAMAIASGQSMRAFSTRESADAWLASRVSP